MSELVTAFRMADRAHTQAVVAWNAFPTPEARQASGIDWPPIDAARQDTATALVADAAARHKIEQKIGIYLTLNPDGWVIDGGSHCGITDREYADRTNDDCDHDDDAGKAECDAVAAASELVPMPGVRRLIAMLTDQLDAQEARS